VNENLKGFFYICGITSGILLVAVTLTALFGNPGLVRGVVYGYLVSLANILFAYYSIKWAFGKSNSTFFSVVLGGMGVRFASVLLALFLVWKFSDIPIVAFVVSLMGFYLMLQFFEIRYIQKELSRRKATT